MRGTLLWLSYLIQLFHFFRYSKRLTGTHIPEREFKTWTPLSPKLCETRQTNIYIYIAGKIMQLAMLVHQSVNQPKVSKSESVVSGRVVFECVRYVHFEHSTVSFVCIAPLFSSSVHHHKP